MLYMIKLYLKSRRAVILLYMCFVAVFSAVFYVYGMDMGILGYGVLMCTFLFLLWLAYDLSRFLRKRRQLEEINRHIGQYSHRFPGADDDIEWQYQQIAGSLYKITEEHSNAISSAHAEQMDYYTMWLHQIKIPISAMRLALDSGRGDASLFRQELFKIERYVEMALQYVKLEDLSSDLVIREYEIGVIVRQSLKKFAVLFSCSELSVELGDMEQMVTTDSKWLGFIIEQLLSNAVKYTLRGTIEIGLDGKGLVIRDTGIGIRSEDLARIFEKGYTGYNGRLDQRASGIGLYMAKRVADQLAIEIVITSTPGAGTSARIVFPDRLQTAE
ncbi:signal transduction histidine kinase [Anaerobacterium chartisolvens]|uniref:histidine kinase n=1 Tax=Anaerobacterium chartisolvens TaxID=1297424 RepID=A0A369B6F8_9FIRM|nr:sensor histidine kinase [Anaerobacterium chartisolvens]RCX16117.1 signal transduction histidine kinase [Anaerobacterium chartisolvens]